MESPEDRLDYRSVLDLADDPHGIGPAAALASPDRRDGAVYVYGPELKLVVEVALVTGRPLLLRGKPGTGKSSLAPYIARNLGWSYYEQVITARTRARDLLWSFDAVRRLGDAQARVSGAAELYDFDYVEPGILWWVFDRESAGRRGAPPERLPRRLAREPGAGLNSRRSPEGAVVLLDEIDKADPDVPNDLLVPLGSLEFRVEETDTPVCRPLAAAAEEVSRLLVVITTNEERDLPDAFLRRCVVHELEPPDTARLVEIARRHLAGPEGGLSREEGDLCEAVAGKIIELRGQAADLGVREPSTAEFLDAVRACRNLRIGVGSRAWQSIERAVLRKLHGLKEDRQMEGAWS
jgi:MoxR-like ATPase